MYKRQGLDREEAQKYIDEAAEADADGNFEVDLDEYMYWYYRKMTDGQR